MKYIIEIEDEPFTKDGNAELFRVKGFNSLVFDRFGIEKLTPYEEKESEQGDFRVGDEVVDADGREAYVLVPNINGKVVLLMKEYASPQYSSIKEWKKTGLRNKLLMSFIGNAARILIEEKKND